MQKLALFFCTFTTLCALTWAQAYPGAQTQQQPSSQTPPAGQMTPGQGMVTADPSAQLHRDMRKLWTDHVVYTRDFIIAATENPSDVSAVTNRLMKNQEDIGDAISKFYGRPARSQLTSLLKQHIQIAANLVKAAVAKDESAKQQADQQWHQNAQQIAAFLSQANPNWAQATLMDLMAGHLQTTSDELKARLSKDWNGDVQAYDAVYNHILRFSDALSDGIVKQFPDKFPVHASL